MHSKNRVAFALAARTTSYLRYEPTPEESEGHESYAALLKEVYGLEFKYCPANKLYAWLDGTNTFSHAEMVRGCLNMKRYQSEEVTKAKKKKKKP